MPFKDPDKKRSHHRIYMKKRWAAASLVEKAKHKALVKENQKKYRKQAANLVAEFRANGCQFCPERETCCLAAHHLDPTEKDFDISKANSIGASGRKVAAELKKCICVCHNCHAKIHSGLLGSDLRVRTALS